MNTKDYQGIAVFLVQYLRVFAFPFAGRVLLVIVGYIVGYCWLLLVVLLVRWEIPGGKG